MDGLVSDVDHFFRRLIIDALTSAMAETWGRRSLQFEAARPKEGDYTGRASAEDVQMRDQRLAAQAQACRNHARIVEFDDFEDLLATVLAESADAIEGVP